MTCFHVRVTCITGTDTTCQFIPHLHHHLQPPSLVCLNPRLEVKGSTKTMLFYLVLLGPIYSSLNSFNRILLNTYEKQSWHITNNKQQTVVHITYMGSYSHPSNAATYRTSTEIMHFTNIPIIERQFSS